MAEKQIGKITHYFSKASVGVIEITDGDLKVGDVIKIQGPKTDFEQTISSMQIDRVDIPLAAKGQSVGIKVDQPVKEHDVVYKM